MPHPLVPGKVALLLLVAGAANHAITPPTPRPPADERLKPSGIELAAPKFHLIAKTILWTLTTCETLTILAIQYPSLPHSDSVLAHLVRTHDPAAFHIPQLTPSFLLGTALVLLGASLRVYCTRTLGRFFTFELSLRADHRLLTAGPYGLVRHPSYTGILLLVPGLLLCQLSPHSWLVACSGLLPVRRQLASKVLVALSTAVVSLMTYGLTKRMQKEDRMLEQRFGGEWRAWASKVPYRLIPGVY